jgi:hypothetical protein
MEFEKETQVELLLDFSIGARAFVENLPTNQTLFKKPILKELCRTEMQQAYLSNVNGVFINYAKGALLFVIGLQVKANQEITKDELLDLVHLQYRKAQEAYLSSIM